MIRAILCGAIWVKIIFADDSFYFLTLFLHCLRPCRLQFSHMQLAFFSPERTDIKNHTECLEPAIVKHGGHTSYMQELANVRSLTHHSAIITTFIDAVSVVMTHGIALIFSSTVYNFRLPAGPAACCLLLAACCLLSAAYHMLLAVRCLLD
jgi:hypothetical protein